MKWVVAVPGIGVGVLGSQLIARVPPGHQAGSPAVRPQPFDRAGSSSAAPLPFGEVFARNYSGNQSKEANGGDP